MKYNDKVKIIFVFVLFSFVGNYTIGDLGLFIGIIIGTLYMILIELCKISSYLKVISSKDIS